MSFRKIRVAFICVTGLFLATPNVSYAGSESGFFLGIGAGDAAIEDTDFDESDTAYKVFAGYSNRFFFG